MTRIVQISLACAAAVLLAACGGPAAGTSPAPSGPCDMSCEVVVSNGTNEEVEVYFADSGPSGARRPLGTVRARGSSTFVVPRMEAGNVSIQAFVGPRLVGAYGVALAPGRAARVSLRSALDRSN